MRRRRSSFSAQWEDVESNSRDDLLQIMKDLELPYHSSMTHEQLVAIVKNHVAGGVNPVTRAKVRQIYTHDRYIRKFSLPALFVHRVIFFIVCVILLLLLHRLSLPPPFCSSDRKFEKCRPCPPGGRCSRGRVTCPKGTFLSVLGCRSKIEKKTIRRALKASIYIADRDGDCIEAKPYLTTEEFSYVFPKVNLTFLASEPGFNIEVVNGSVRSTDPSPAMVCRFMNAIEHNANITGFVSFAIITAVIIYLVRRRKHERMRLAMDIAKQAHKILATTDKQIYMYDMKVQLRARYPNIDSLWKWVVRYVEDDSHVLVGLVGASHEVYWKWLHTPN